MLDMVKIHMAPAKIIALGYFILILMGGILLSLPAASRAYEATPFMDALFTSTSATCVTGLVLYDTYTHWSLFGQIVILILIQTGGLGFLTIITLFSMFLKRKIGLRERRLLMESASTMRIGGVVLLIKKVLIATIVFEGLGTIILSTRFIPEMGFLTGLYYALFHAISAFCNAGFDIMGRFGPFSSLTTYTGDLTVNLTIMSLIIIGGLGFIVWDDISKNGLSFRKYQLHTKIVLVTTGILLAGGSLLFYLFERQASLAGLGLKETLLASMFQAVTPRTAGFNTVDMASLSESGSLLTMALMFIGGSPGSTAGGIKTTTLAVLLLGIYSSSRMTQEVSLFRKSLEINALKRASAVASIYLLAALASSMLICAFQPFDLKDVLFEVLSAEGTVGLTRGITTQLNLFSKCLVAFLMYGGRVGGLSLALVLVEKQQPVLIKRPVEKIIIG